MAHCETLFQTFMPLYCNNGERPFPGSTSDTSALFKDQGSVIL